MSHSVRSTLLCLGGGVVLQRALQLVAFVLVGRALGVAGLGVYAQGLALAAILTVVSGAGVRNLVARAVSREPDAAGALVAHAVQLRLLVGCTLAIVAVGVAFVAAERPWFWLLCALHVVPAAFDLKNLVDAAGRTRSEVLLESAAAALQLGGVAAWAALDGERLEVLAAVGLACRCVYAAGAVLAIRRLPQGSEPSAKPVGLNLASVGQTAHELLAIGDVALVAVACGDACAGYYAVAARFAAAAMLPSAQLARLLLPHLLHAGRGGDADRTFATALRATLWWTLPVCAGGAVVADAVCALSGAEFASSGAALRLLLLAGVCQHVGWQCSHALLAARRDRAYAHGLLWPAVAQALAITAMVAGTDGGAAAAAATWAALAAAGAQLAYAVAGLAALGGAGARLPKALPGPTLAALATAGGAALTVAWLPVGARLPAHLLLGGAAFFVVLWAFELRGRLRRVGDGLATASGFTGRRTA